MQYKINNKSLASVFLLRTFLHFLKFQPAYAKLLYNKRLRHIVVYYFINF